MRSYVEAREALGDLKRRIQMTHRVLVQKRQGEEEVKSLVEEVERTEKLVECERDKNRQVIHRNGVRLGEMRKGIEDA